MKFIYFFYALKKTNFSTLHSHITYIMPLMKWSYLKVIWELLLNFIRHTTFFSEYFDFEFYRKSEAEKTTYLHPVYMYHFQKKMNHTPSRTIFKQKDLFLEKFHDFIDHTYFLPFINEIDQFRVWLKCHRPQALILKNNKGYKGKGIEKVMVTQKDGNYLFDAMTISELYSFVKKKELDLIEIAIEQHDILDDIYPKSLNTVRIITVIDQHNNVHIIGAMLRVGTVGVVDNFSANGVSAAIDLQTGIVKAPLVSRDIRIKHKKGEHPITKKKIIGIQLPFWEDLKEMVIRAAMVVPSVRTVGWDVALTNKGPYLLEGNDNWSQNIWQVTSQKGLKKDLDIFLV